MGVVVGREEEDGEEEEGREGGGSEAAWIKFPITVRVELTHSFCVGGTGSGVFFPSSGSRIMAEAKDEAAPEGGPGRIRICFFLEGGGRGLVVVVGFFFC